MKSVLAIALFVTLVAVVCSEPCRTDGDCEAHHITHCAHHTEKHCHDSQCECLTAQEQPCSTDSDCTTCTGQHVHAHCVHNVCHCAGH